MRRLPALCTFPGFLFLALASARSVRAELSAEELSRGAFLPDVVLQRLDGELWANGGTYKAAFDAGRLLFVPALGAEAPENLPLALELVAARRGAEVIALASADAVVAGDRRVERRRGGLVEAYDAGLEGVELSFLLEAWPAGGGDLVLRLELATGLARPAAGAYPEGLAFSAGGGRGVSVGGVTAFDAAGRRVAGELLFDGSALELRVPGAFLDAASAPVLVDPLVSTFGIQLGADQRNSDLAYDDSAGTYLVAWQRYYSIGDGDIWCRRLNDTGAAIGSLIVLENSIANSGEFPAVGCAAANDCFLVAWQEEHPTAGWNIVGRRVTASTGLFSNAALLAGSSDDESWPDVSSSVSDGRVLVVWQQSGLGILGRSVQIAAAGDPVLFATTAYSLNFNAGRPALSRSTDSLGQHLLIWQQWYASPSPGDHDVHGLVVTNHGAELGDLLVLANDVGPDEWNPEVDGDGHSWLVAWQRAPASTTFAGEIRTARVIESGSGFAVDTTDVLLESEPSSYPAVAHSGEAYVVAYEVFFPTLGTETLRVRTVDAFCNDCSDTATLDGTHVAIAAPFGIASQRSGSASALPPDEALIAYCTFPTTTGGAELQGARWRTDSGLFVSLSASCSGAEPSAQCANAGNVNFKQRLAGVDPFAPCWLLLSAETEAQACSGGAGGCVLLLSPFTSLLFATTADALGRAVVSTPLIDSPALAGLSYNEQWAFLPSGPPSCPALGVSLSDGLRVTIE